MPQDDILDLAQPTATGLLRGYTTGACAASGTYAAALLCLGIHPPTDVLLPLLGKPGRLRIPVESVRRSNEGWCCASVIKEAGDDPDVTHHARIIVRVRGRSDGPSELQFFGGPGVGRITRPGLALPPGEPAINPGPRRMIAAAIAMACEDAGLAGSDLPHGWDVEVGVDGGDHLAARTFNPRLGIEGGISILGTTGLVEPKSHEAFIGAIQAYFGVALAPPVEQIALVPGNLGQTWARSALRLPDDRIIQISNFLGEALDLLCATLATRAASLPLLWVAGHPGKLVKILEGHWNTHSHRATAPRHTLAATVTRLWPERHDWVQACGAVNTVQEWIEYLQQNPDASSLFWTEITRLLEEAIAHRVAPLVPRVRVRLFSLDGHPLTTPDPR